MNGTTDMTHGAARGSPSAEHSAWGPHFSGISLNSTLVVALVAIALAGIVVLSGVTSVFSSAFAGSIHEGQPKEVIDNLVATHDAKIKEYQGRFKSRYVFFKPPPPPPPPSREPKRVEPVETKPPEPSGPPEVYPGPSVAWVIGDDVYFNLNPPTQTEKYMRIKVGQERNGTTVINIEKMPRTVRVGHSGGEYDVKVFGESTSPTTLFPTTPLPSILTPGIIPVAPAAQPAAVVAEGDDGGNDGENGMADAGANAAVKAADADPASQATSPDRRGGSSRGEGPRGEGRRRPRDAASDPGERPDDAGGKEQEPRGR